MTVGGRGDWRTWNGRALATLGAEQVADLGVAERDGSFRIKGQLRPGLVLTGPAARLTEPAILLDALAKLDKRRVDLTANAHSAAFTADAAGLLDLANSRFGNFRIDARLLTPGVIAKTSPGATCGWRRCSTAPSRDPTVDYRASAAALAFNATGIEGLVAQGRATIDSDRILVPVHAVARRVTGLNAAVGGLLTNLRIDGDPGL